MLNKYFVGIVIIILFVALNSQVYSYDGKVHALLNKNAVTNSKLEMILKYILGLEIGSKQAISIASQSKQVVDWIAYGGKAEDFGLGFLDNKAGTRAFNHFHDPLKPWDEAGLDCAFNFLYVGRYFRDPVSPILWGLEPGNQDFEKNITGDWSWSKAKEHYYTFLTGKDTEENMIASTKRQKEAYLAQCLRSVGQVMHLLQDMSVPLHTRNDVHVIPIFSAGKPIYGTFETFTKKNKDFLNYTPSSPRDFPDPLLISGPNPDPNYMQLPAITGLFDRNQYNQGNRIPVENAPIGLSEYSNANFLTQDTMWKYPHPDLSDTNYSSSIWINPEEVDAEDGQKDNRIYIKKVTGDPVEHLVAADYWFHRLYRTNELALRYTFLLDEQCFSDYADKLIPKAVGYSAAMLDYFFRGTIDITIPEDGFYALTTNPNQGFSQIKLLAKNTTANGEEMTNGSIQLVVKYRLSEGDPFTNSYSNTSSQFYYITVAEAGNISNIPRDDYAELTFDLTGNPIPLWATDVYLQVVYKGQLGDEAGGIAVGFKDISEPTFIDIFNVFDKVCLFGEWADAGAEAVGIVDLPDNGGDGNGIADEYDAYIHNFRDIYYRFWPASMDGVLPAPDPDQGDFHYFIPELAAGRRHRGPYFLSDYKFQFTFILIIEPLDPDDCFVHEIFGGKMAGNAIKNQIEWDASAGNYIRPIPIFNMFRGIETLNHMVICTVPYPIPEASCSFDELE